MGLPASWLTVECWLDKSVPVFFPPQVTKKEFVRKCPDVPTLPTYSLPPAKEFWDSFPFRPLPTKPVSALNFQKLNSIAADLFPRMEHSQVIRARRTVYELEHGSTAPLLRELPALRVPNARSAALHGDEFTDTLSYWIEKKFVSGPFPCTPVQGFRANAMMAIEQKDKIRIVMDLSSPKGASFNEAVDDLRLEKVSMSTARKFGYSVIDCGKGARMWKWDFQDAYKNIPAPVDSFRLQGFRWLGMSFIETQKVFGDKEAVSAFDRLGRTVADMACIISNLPQSLVHRVLDDTPIVSPASRDEGRKFSIAYQSICKEIGATLAPTCPRKEKAFSDSTSGSVLGISFNTISLTWSLTNEKADKVLRRIQNPLLGCPLTLLETQKLLGSLNDVGQMCPFLSGFRHHLLESLTDFGGDESVQRTLSEKARQELHVWAAAVHTAKGSLPIPHRPAKPSLQSLTFVSDAAGAQFIRQGDFFTPYCTDEFRGAASISMDENSKVWFCARIFWPKHFLLKARDSKNHAYGCKSSTLEAIGALLPFVCCPSVMAGRDIVLLTDNEPIVYGWDSRRVQHDESASIIIRAIHILSHFLGCPTSILHLPRKSTPAASLADELTRSSTTKRGQLNAIRGAPHFPIPAVLLDWLQHPTEDWDLPIHLLQDVKSRM